MKRDRVRITTNVGLWIPWAPIDALLLFPKVEGEVEAKLWRVSVGKVDGAVRKDWSGDESVWRLRRSEAEIGGAVCKGWSGDESV